MNLLSPESFFTLVASKAGIGSRPAENGIISFRCGCGETHSVLPAERCKVRGDPLKAFVLPCPDARAEAALTLIELRGLLWSKRPVSVAATTIKLAPVAHEIVADATARAGSWLQECAAELKDSSYRSDPLYGFEIRLGTPSAKDRLRIAGFAIYNLLIWLQTEGYLADQAIVELRALIARLGEVGPELETGMAYNKRTHIKARAKLYDSFIGATTKLLTRSNKNTKRLVVEGKLYGLLLPTYSTAAAVLGDANMARELRQKNEVVRSQIQCYAEF